MIKKKVKSISLSLSLPIDDSNELVWFSRPRISLNGHVPVPPIIRPMSTADEVTDIHNPLNQQHYRHVLLWFSEEVEPFWCIIRTTLID